jgi:hypothetical protein
MPRSGLIFPGAYNCSTVSPVLFQPILLAYPIEMNNRHFKAGGVY